MLLNGVNTDWFGLNISTALLCGETFSLLQHCAMRCCYASRYDYCQNIVLQNLARKYNVVL